MKKGGVGGIHLANTPGLAGAEARPYSGQGDLRLTPEGSRHMVLRKIEVEIGNSG